MNGPNNEFMSVMSSLTEEETRALLTDVPAFYRSQINDVLLAALVKATQEWTGESSLLVNLEGHGREEIMEGVDLSRTVGWFTSMYPVLLDIGKARKAGDAVKAIKDQLRKIPNKGIGYGLLRYLNQGSEVERQLSSQQSAEIGFNYLGQFDQGQAEGEGLFGGAAESTGSNMSTDTKRNHLIDFSSLVADGRLHVTWMYSPNRHQHRTIEALSEGYMEALREIIANGQVSEEGDTSASEFGDLGDFEDFGWDNDDLEDLMDKLSSKK
jgi:non-ribosomal peptide synthase protein (TIGR01720 family)